MFPSLACPAACQGSHLDLGGASHLADEDPCAQSVAGAGTLHQLWGGQNERRLEPARPPSPIYFHLQECQQVDTEVLQLRTS